MTLPDTVDNRAALDALYARVEMCEGAQVALRIALAAAVAGMDEQTRKRMAAVLPMLKADALVTMQRPQGQYLRGAETLAKAQGLGFEGEWRQLIGLLQDSTPG